MDERPNHQERQHSLWTDAELKASCGPEGRPAEFDRPEAPVSSPPANLFDVFTGSTKSDAAAIKRVVACLLDLESDQVTPEILNAFDLCDLDKVDRDLRKRLASYEGEARERFRQDQARFRKILRGLGLVMRDGRGHVRPSPAWQAICKTLSRDDAGPLRSIASFATERGIEPLEFKQPWFNQYFAHLRLDRPEKAARVKARRAKAAFGKARLNHPNLTRLEMPGLKLRRVITEPLPPSLEARIESLFGPGGSITKDPSSRRAKRWKQDRVQDLRRILFEYHAVFGAFPDDLEHLVDPSVAHRVLQHTRTHTKSAALPNQYGGVLVDLSLALNPDDWRRSDALREVRRKFRYRVVEIKRRSRDLFRRFRNFEVVKLVQSLPTKLLGALRPGQNLSGEQLDEQTSIFTWHLLLVAPTYPSNLARATFEEGGNFSFEAHPEPHVLVTFPPRSGRNERRQTYEFFGRELIAWHSYTELIRPRLARAPTPKLVLGIDGTPRSTRRLSQGVAQVTAKHLGFSIVASEFRILAGFIELGLDPDNKELVAAKIGVAAHSRLFESLCELVEQWRDQGFFSNWPKGHGS